MLNFYELEQLKKEIIQKLKFDIPDKFYLNFDIFVEKEKIKLIPNNIFTLLSFLKIDISEVYSIDYEKNIAHLKRDIFGSNLLKLSDNYIFTVKQDARGIVLVPEKKEKTGLAKIFDYFLNSKK